MAVVHHTYKSINVIFVKELIQIRGKNMNESYMSDPEAKTVAGWVTSLFIFAWHLEKGVKERYIFQGEHDIIYGPSVPDKNHPDGIRLEMLGWHWNDENSCWAMFT